MNQPYSKLYHALFIVLIFGIFSCNTEKKADTIYFHANIWTGDPENPYAEAIGISGNQIVFAGNTYQDHQDSHTQMIDLGGKMIVPGFIDNHVHFLQGGAYLGGVDLRPAQTKEDFVNTLTDYAQKQPEGTWITGGDWDHEAWGGELPKKEWIDAGTADRFVYVNRLDGHMVLVNSAVLKKAGITNQTPDPVGGTIVRDPRTGEATGVLKDEAMSLVVKIIPEATEQELDQTLDRAISHTIALGVTQVHDVSSLGGWTDLATYQRAKARNRLHLRMWSLVPLGDWEKMRDYVAQHGKGDDKLRWGALKGFVDGSLGSTTAWFYDVYEDEPHTAGFTVTDTADLYSWMDGADQAGLHLAIHAIGDQANGWLLGAFDRIMQKNGNRRRRYSIEHAQHLHPGLYPKFSELGVIPSMQPFHAIDDGRWAEKRIGPERIKGTYAFKSLLDAGAHLTFGSDWTVAPINPLEGIYAAATRATLDGANPEGWVPEQKIKVEEALRAYTVNNAFAGFQEDRLGMLKTGFLADLIVLSENILDIDPGAIRNVKVLRTIIDGEEVYKRK